jgi:Tetratricopeptide repeat
MNLPDGRPLLMPDGVLPEPGPAGRVVLWLPGPRSGGYQYWDRIGTVAHASMTAKAGICAIAVAAIRARQWVGGPIGGFLHRLARPRAEHSLTLPDGGTAEQCEPRRTDLVLAWPEGDATSLDEERIRALWREARECRPIGPGLYLVAGVEPDRPAPEPGPISHDSPLQLAERALASARTTGDPRREVTALADLGLAQLKAADVPRARTSLEEALAAARRLGEPAREADVLVDLGLVELISGRPERARQILGPSLDLARSIGDRHAEKLALDRFGQAQADLGDHSAALAHYQQALAIAKDLGDHHHEADVLWRLGIQYAELGRRDPALAHAQAAVDLMRRLGRPQFAWYAHHLAHFRSGDPETESQSRDLAKGDVGRMAFGGSIDTSILATPTAAPKKKIEPGPLRMALSAIGSMAKFLGSGFETATAEVHRSRVEICSTCEHHTGLRCRVCGCFTAAKARLRHEHCPLGKWRE